MDRKSGILDRVNLGIVGIVAFTAGVISSGISSYRHAEKNVRPYGVEGIDVDSDKRKDIVLRYFAGQPTILLQQEDGAYRLLDDERKERQSKSQTENDNVQRWYNHLMERAERSEGAEERR